MYMLCVYRKGGSYGNSEGHYIFGTVKVGERGQIIIPKEARDVFDIRAGDMLIVSRRRKMGNRGDKGGRSERTCRRGIPENRRGETQ